MTEHQTENTGKLDRCNILKSSYMKFYPIWFMGWGEMALDGQTDKTETICLLFGEHKKLFVKHECPYNGHFLFKKIILIFDLTLKDGLDHGTKEKV